VSIGQKEDRQQVVLFDGVCGMCNASVDFILNRDRDKKFLFSALQGKFANEQFPQECEDLNTIIYFRNGKILRRSSAVLQILVDLGWPWVVVWPLLLIPAFLRDLFYRIIANSRHLISKKRATCRLPSPEEKDRFLD
jgi:predicted DCC family thiol-disulfide oxidoreductase YuxK